MKHQQEKPEQSLTGSQRRQILAAAPLIAAAGALWKPTAASAQKGNGIGSRLTLDVACFGDTFRGDFDGVASGERRGATFFVEGAIYPQGAIPPGPGFDPSSAASMMLGHWLCRGWFIDHPGRPEPQSLRRRSTCCRSSRARNLPPPDTLVSSGVEGGILVSHRAILGGSGKYRHARGDVAQEVIGTNITVLPSGDNAPNFRFHLTSENAISAQKWEPRKGRLEDVRRSRRSPATACQELPIREQTSKQ